MKNLNLNTQQDELNHVIILALLKLSQVFRSLLWRYTKSIGISPIQIQILIYIAQHRENENRVTSLARDFDLTAATVSDAVKSLEKKKLLRRSVSKTDRRKIFLSLTKSGKMLAEKLSSWQKPMLQQLNAFTQETRRTFSSFLIKYIDSLGNAELLSDAKTCYSCFHFEKIRNPEAKIEYFCIYRQIPMKDFDLRLDCANYESKYE